MKSVVVNKDFLMKRRGFLKLLGAVGVAPAAMTVGAEARTAGPEEVEFYDDCRLAGLAQCRVYGLSPGTTVALVTDTHLIKGTLLFYGKVPKGSDFIDVQKTDRPCYLRAVHLGYNFLQLEFESLKTDELYVSQQVDMGYIR